jgi:hypothetical protein
VGEAPRSLCYKINFDGSFKADIGDGGWAISSVTRLRTLLRLVQVG